MQLLGSQLQLWSLLLPAAALEPPAAAWDLLCSCLEAAAAVSHHTLCLRSAAGSIYAHHDASSLEPPAAALPSTRCRVQGSGFKVLLMVGW